MGGGDNTLQVIKLKKKKKETSLCAILQKQEQKVNAQPDALELSGRRLRGALQPPSHPHPMPQPCAGTCTPTLQCQPSPPKLTPTWPGPQAAPQSPKQWHRHGTDSHSLSHPTGLPQSSTLCTQRLEHCPHQPRCPTAPTPPARAAEQGLAWGAGTGSRAQRVAMWCKQGEQGMESRTWATGTEHTPGSGEQH